MTERTITADWSEPTTLLIGNHRARELITRIKEHGSNSTLLIIDKVMAQSLTLKKLLKSFDKASLSFGAFSLNASHVDKDILSLAQRIFKDGGFNSLIAIGGTGTIDLAKLIAFHNIPDENSTSYSTDGYNKKLPIFVLPGDMNNGAQFSTAAFIIEQEGPGQFIFNEQLLPTCVFLDPSLFSKTDRLFIAPTAMNALASALETWCLSEFNPAKKAIALEAMRLIFDNLLPALKDTNSKSATNINAHIKLMSAMVLAHSQTNNKLSVAAAFAQALEVFCGVNSSLACSVLLPYVLNETSDTIKVSIGALAKALKISGGFNGFLKALIKLQQDAGLPMKLSTLLEGRELKVKDKILIETYAASYPHISNTHMPQKAAIKVFTNALSGELKGIKSGELKKAKSPKPIR